MAVSTSGFYKHINKKQTPRQKHYEELRSFIIQQFFYHQQRMGALQLYCHLRNCGKLVTLAFIKTVFKKNGLVSRIIKTYKKRVKPHKTFSNKLARNFSAKKDELIRIVCDITEFPLTNGKKGYLCVAMNLADRSIAGYQVWTHQKKELVLNVLEQVYKRYKGKPLLFHSDQGTQFTSRAVIEFIQNQNWRQSMSRRGNCWDNAVIESFFSIIKREELKWHALHSRRQAHQVITRYIYGYYLPIRPHTALGGLSPYDYQKNS